MKSEGNRVMLRRTCSFSRFVETPYKSARSRSSITLSPRIARMRRSTRCASALVLVSLVMPESLLSESQRPVNGSWSPATPLPEPIQELSAAVLHGKIYIAGGFDRSGKPIAKPFRFDPAPDRWERIGGPPEPRHP